MTDLEPPPYTSAELDGLLGEIERAILDPDLTWDGFKPVYDRIGYACYRVNGHLAFGLPTAAEVEEIGRFSARLNALSHPMRERFHPSSLEEHHRGH